MSEIKMLIKELCPDGVEFVSVNDLINNKVIKVITPSFKIKKNDYKNAGTFPIISQEKEYISGYCNSEDKKLVNDEYVCFGDHSEHIKYIDFSFVQGADGLKIIKCISKKLNTKYFYYVLCNFYKRYNNYERHFKYFIETNIPLPPIEVQREIVRILDEYSEKVMSLNQELEKELELRKKQYAYYRDKLLTFGDNVEYKKIKDIYKRLKGTSITAGKMKEISDNEGEIKIFAGGKTVINARESDIPKANITKVPAVLVQSRGIIDVIYYDKPFTFKSEMWAYTHENNITVKYLYYIMKNSLRYFRECASEMGSMPQISLTVTENLKIPVPPIEEQERIVKILDRFDTLCNDLTSGIPAEISARKKQYEYYRDRLLQFN